MRPLGCLVLILLHALTVFAAPVPVLIKARTGRSGRHSSDQHLHRRFSPPWHYVIPSFIIGMDLNHAIANLDRQKVRGTFSVLGWSPFLPSTPTTYPTSDQFGRDTVPILSQPPIPRPHAPMSTEEDGQGGHLERRDRLERRGHYGWLVGGLIGGLELDQLLKGKNPLDILGLPFLSGKKN